MLRKVALSLTKHQAMMQMYKSSNQVRLLVPAQQRLIHSRGYTNFDDHHSYWFNEINFALSASKNTENIVFVYKKYGEYMTDKQIMFGFNFICMNKLEKSEDFWNVILPMVKDQIKGLDRQTPRALFMAIEGAAGMYL